MLMNGLLKKLCSLSTLLTCISIPVLTLSCGDENDGGYRLCAYSSSEEECEFYANSELSNGLLCSYFSAVANCYTTDNSIDFSWDECEGADYYEVEVNGPNHSSDSYFATDYGTYTYELDSKAQSGSYSFNITAFDYSGHQSSRFVSCYKSVSTSGYSGSGGSGGHSGSGGSGGHSGSGGSSGSSCNTTSRSCSSPYDVACGTVKATVSAEGAGYSYSNYAQWVNGKSTTISWSKKRNGTYLCYGGTYDNDSDANGGKGVGHDCYVGSNKVRIDSGYMYDNNHIAQFYYVYLKFDFHPCE